MTTQPEVTLFERYEQEYANDPEFVAEGLAIKFTEELLEILEQRGLSQSWLAERMGVSRAHVSRILNARPNLTLLTIAKIAVALGVKPDVCLETKTCKVGQTKRRSKVIARREDEIDAAGGLASLGNTEGTMSLEDSLASHKDDSPMCRQR